MNEFHYDNVGSDINEFVELVGQAGLDVTGYKLILVNGANNLPYFTTTLSGVITDTGSGVGYYVVNYAPNGIQNGSPDGIQIQDAAGNIIQYISYEGPMPGADSISGIEDGTKPATSSLQLFGVGNKPTDFTWREFDPSSPGAINTGQNFA